MPGFGRRRTQRGLALELVRLQRELAAIDKLDTAILSLRCVISNLVNSLDNEKVKAVEGAEAVHDAFLRFTRIVQSLYVRLRPELRSVVGPFAKAHEWLGELRANAEILDYSREDARRSARSRGLPTPDDPGRTE